jgi:hypothetical protein
LLVILAAAAGAPAGETDSPAGTTEQDSPPSSSPRPGQQKVFTGAVTVTDNPILNPPFAPGQAKVDGNLLVNGKAGIPLRWLGLQVGGEIFVAGQNLAAEEYELRIGYPMPGRAWNPGIDIGS